MVLLITKEKLKVKSEHTCRKEHKYARGCQNNIVDSTTKKQSNQNWKKKKDIEKLIFFIFKKQINNK